jgi:hypothetical protein
MLYLSQPIGGGSGGALHPRFGFRIEQVRMMGNSGAPDAGDPVQHRTLVGWQLDDLRGLHASNMKLELGGRMTYDLTRGAFKPINPRDSQLHNPPPRAGFRIVSEPPPRTPPPRELPSPVKLRPPVPLQ